MRLVLIMRANPTPARPMVSHSLVPRSCRSSAAVMSESMAFAFYKYSCVGLIIQNGKNSLVVSKKKNLRRAAVLCRLHSRLL